MIIPATPIPIHSQRSAPVSKSTATSGLVRLRTLGFHAIFGIPLGRVVVLISHRLKDAVLFWLFRWLLVGNDSPKSFWQPQKSTNLLMLGSKKDTVKEQLKIWTIAPASTSVVWFYRTARNLWAPPMPCFTSLVRLKCSVCLNNVWVYKSIWRSPKLGNSKSSKIGPV